jgi:hypothetical protein
MDIHELRLAALDRAIDTMRATVSEKFGPQEIDPDAVISMAKKYLGFVADGVENDVVVEND